HAVCARSGVPGTASGTRDLVHRLPQCSGNFLRHVPGRTAHERRGIGALQPISGPPVGVAGEIGRCVEPPRRLHWPRAGYSGQFTSVIVDMPSEPSVLILAATSGMSASVAGPRSGPSTDKAEAHASANMP